MAIRFKSGSLWQLVGSDNFNSFSADTEILTRDGGWLLFSELTGDELVATLDEGDELVYAPIRQVMSYDYSGEMYRVYNNAIDLLTTPNHQFYVESQERGFASSSGSMTRPSLATRYRRRVPGAGLIR